MKLCLKSNVSVWVCTQHVGMFEKIFKNWLHTYICILYTFTETNIDISFRAVSSHFSTLGYHTIFIRAETHLAHWRAKHFCVWPNGDERYDSTVVSKMWICHPISPTFGMRKVTKNWRLAKWPGTQLLRPIHSQSHFWFFFKTIIFSEYIIISFFWHY